MLKTVFLLRMQEFFIIIYLNSIQFIKLSDYTKLMLVDIK